MDIKGLIPKHKLDIDTITKLKKLKYPAYQPILGELLVWVQDMNWPVAQEIVPLLIKANKDLIPHIKNALNTDDSSWKYWILNEIISQLPKKTLLLLKEDLQRLVNSSSKDDKVQEIDLLAQKILKKL